ncbi:PAS domain-containing protein [Chitinophaga deserti]|uniref:PAS domain-containing protein n=1 Tax=Chitinophaga deserti TaxID=2164099 RepID=UPI000D6BE128|nr:PAS domain S-box protein [Chitinophaga deserti]
MSYLLSPLRTVLIYFAAGVLWIFLTDSLLQWLAEHSPSLMLGGQYAKGFLFIILSSVLLFLLLSKSRRSIRTLEMAYMRVFRESPQPMWIYDQKTLEFVDVNDAAIHLYGYKLEEFLTMNILQIRPQEDVQKVLDATRFTTTGFQNFGTWKHLKKDGGLLYVDIRTFGTHYKGREVEIVSIADVTDKHLAYEALSRQELLLNSIINSTSDLIWAVDDQKHYTAFNNAFRDGIRIFKGQEVHVGGPLVKGDSEAEINRWNEYYNRSLLGEVLTIEESLELEEMGLAYSEITFHPIRKQQRIVGVSCFARDITQRKHQELSLQKALDRYEMVTLATSNVIWDYDISSNTIHWNNNLTTLFGYRKADETEDWWLHHVHPEDAPRITTGLTIAIQEKRHTYSAEYRFLCADGKYRHIFDRVFIMYNDEGAPIRMIGAMEDIEDKKVYVEELQKVAHMSSHSLRRPVASMLGVVGLINKDNLTDPANLPLLAGIEKIAQEMDEIIHTVADKCNMIFKDVVDK